MRDLPGSACTGAGARNPQQMYVRLSDARQAGTATSEARSGGRPAGPAVAATALPIALIILSPRRRLGRLADVLLLAACAAYLILTLHRS
jgi:hypothetical protein